jgi:N-acetylglucosamine kinase-like BadF-type ATPase
MSGSNAKELVLVLDAGGTKTAAWLVELGERSQHHVLGRGRSSAGNPTSVGFAEATRVIAEAIDRARDEAGRPAEPIARAVLSIAGALDPEMRNQLIGWARSKSLAQQVAVVPDVLPVLAAGTPQCCGVALICGTGSSAFARSADGRTSLCGGWGYLLGDEGSGYAIGRAALRAALEDEELNTPPRPLTAALLQFLKAGSAIETAKAVYRSPNPRATVASVAPLVIRAAEAGDPQAETLVDAAAHDLAALVSRAARTVGLADGPFALAVTGGVIVGSNRLHSQLHSALRTSRLDCEIGVVEEPLEGCLRLAEQQFSEVAVQWQ